MALAGTCFSSSGAEPCFPVTPDPVSWLCHRAANSAAATALQRLGGVTRDPAGCSPLGQPTQPFLGLSFLILALQGIRSASHSTLLARDTTLSPAGPRPKSSWLNQGTDSCDSVGTCWLCQFPATNTGPTHSRHWARASLL